LALTPSGRSVGIAEEITQEDITKKIDENIQAIKELRDVANAAIKRGQDRIAALEAEVAAAQNTIKEYRDDLKAAQTNYEKAVTDLATSREALEAAEEFIESYLSRRGSREVATKARAQIKALKGEPK
jgi:chromosome segregation ATPase